MNKSISPTVKAAVRILIVDDHPNTAVTLARALSHIDPELEILTAESGERALELVVDKTVDLLITDMVMPGINGLELIEKLQSHPGGRPAYTALVTAYDVPGLKESARRLKVNAVINKPIRPERICQIITKAIEDLGRTTAAQLADAKLQLKILIADDRSDNVTLLSRYLENEGYICLTAFNGEQALAVTRAEMPDLVLLDVSMPEKDGFEALQEIRSDPAIAHIPVIILTAARLEPMDMQYALNIGADDYVTKPFDRRELLARIRTRLRVKETEDIIRQRNRELNLLPEIGRELGARLDINELTDLILRRTVETLGALLGHIILLTPKGPSHKTYHFSASASPVPQVQLPPLTELLTQVKKTRQGLIIGDAHKDSRWQIAKDDPTRAVIIVPMFGRLGLLGLLVLAHEQSNYFNLEHKLLLQAIAGQAAIAVENAQLYSGAVQEQQRLAAVLRSAADAILMFDADAHLTLLNPAGEKLFKDGHAKLDSPLPSGAGYDVFIEYLGAACTTGKAQSAEILWPDRRVFTAQFAPIDAGGCVAILNDVSRFKMLEQAKNEFIATTTHSLKTPLTKISLLSQLIPKIGPLNDKQAEYLRHICETVREMDHVVLDLLELEKMDEGGLELKQEPVKVNELAFEIAEEFQLEVKAREQSLQFERTVGEPEVLADRFQLQRALRNLVNNAIKFAPEKGSIVISVQVDKNAVVIGVKDNGIGISKQDLPFIFDRFYRAQSDELKDIEGVGLGLAIVKSIVERHGGQVSVESERGKGSCFSIRLPVSQSVGPALSPKDNAVYIAS
jgi:signal transduction histidine kinase/response regulator RpfG family c-di-GMP phosphodiesterase